MLQVDPISKASEVINTKPVVVQPKENNSESLKPVSIPEDNIAIPVKDSNYDDPFAKDKDKNKPPVKTTKTKDLIVEDEWETAPKVELNPPRIEIDMRELLNDEILSPGSKQKPPTIY